jgi:hypothetical protein
MSPDAAYIIEKPHLQTLPPWVPPVYQCLFRVEDISGFVSSPLTVPLNLRHLHVLSMASHLRMES